MQCTAELEFSYPDIPERYAAFLTPLAHSLEAIRYMTRAAVVNPPIGQGDKPDVFPEAFGCVYRMEVTTRPNLGSKLFDAALLDDGVIKTNFQTFGVRATCFK